MKLLKATVRNYRIHREVTVEFDPERTLVGGPNESGKSTFVEALHHALFMKARKTGRDRDKMSSDRHPGTPEVELWFTAKGADWHLFKSFNKGRKGAARLTQEGGHTWTDDEAEARLAELLQVEQQGRKEKQQWAHLWVWQGRSGEDPSADTQSEQPRLISRLQEGGGAVAMQSDTDARVMDEIARSYAEYYTQTGKLRAGSDLQLAEEACQVAVAGLEGAQQKLQDVEKAVSEFEAAGRAIAQGERDLEGLRQQQKELQERLDTLARLQREEQEALHAVEKAGEVVARTDEADRSITGLEQEIDELERLIAPGIQEELGLSGVLEEAEQGLGEARKAADAARNLRRNASLQLELARARVTRWSAADKVSELKEKVDEARVLDASFKELRQKIGALPELDEDLLDRMTALHDSHRRAQAALEGMAAEIELLQADSEVRVAGKGISPGDRVRITASTDLSLGDAVHLRVYPGGGNSLTEARAEVARSGEELRELLDRFALESVASATALWRQRHELEADAKMVEKQLKGIDDGTLHQELASAEEVLQRAESDAERRSGMFTGSIEPLDLKEALQELDTAEVSCDRAQETEDESQKVVEGMEARVAATAERVQELKARIEGSKQQLATKRNLLVLLISKHGHKEAREAELASNRQVLHEAEVVLERIRVQLRELQPDLLVGDRERLARSMEQKRDAKSRAMELLGESRAQLRLDGSRDPVAACHEARALLDSAERRRRGIRLRADALALLHELFVEEQRALADRFSKPLAEKVSGYLQALFGPGTEARVTFDNGSFREIRLVRPSASGSVEFDALSGGTREQVAAAVRLAIAELLAADYDGSLPLIFDDAFAYSDPERVQELQRMLDLGARKGLQIIVLSCNPSDYAGLGAREVVLDPQ